MMEKDTINIESVSTILQKLAERVRMRRLELNLTQQEFAKRVGIGYDAYRKFENTGETSLRNLILCAIVLDEVNAFHELFTQVKYQSIQDVIKEKKQVQKQRASKK